MFFQPFTITLQAISDKPGPHFCPPFIGVVKQISNGANNYHFIFFTSDCLMKFFKRGLSRARVIQDDFFLYMINISAHVILYFGLNKAFFSFAMILHCSVIILLIMHQRNRIKVHSLVKTVLSKTKFAGTFWQKCILFLFKMLGHFTQKVPEKLVVHT